MKAGADKVWIDEVGNVIALKEGTKGEKTVALDAHLDTVFPEGTDVKVRFKGDTMLAPGIGDDTRGLVVVLTALRAIEQAQIEMEALQAKIDREDQRKDLVKQSAENKRTEADVESYAITAKSLSQKVLMRH